MSTSLCSADRRWLHVIALPALFLTASCAATISPDTAGTASTPPSGTAPAHSSPTTRVVLLRGGSYRWSSPEVSFGAAGTAPTIVAPKAPDPTTGSAVIPLREAHGAPFTDLPRVRLRYLQQTWSGQVLHDSWHDPGHAEAVPTGRLGDKIHAALLLAHQGDVIEIVIASEVMGNGGGSSVVVLSVDEV